MTLRLLGHVELPANIAQGGFDHADVHSPTDRLYVAHTSNDAVDVIVTAHADMRSSGPSGKGNPFKVRRMASSAPMAFRRPVSITDLMSA